MTRVVSKVTWYNPCMRCSRPGASVRIVVCGKIWVVFWVCGRGLCGCDLEKACCWGVLWDFAGAGEWV